MCVVFVVFLLASKLGSKAWEFATPLLLLNFDPDSLLAPVAYGMITEASVLLLGPTIGSIADRAESRLTVIYRGCLVQVPSLMLLLLCVPLNVILMRRVK